MNHKGFTLLEVLISIIIFSMMIAGLIPVFWQIMSYTQRNYLESMVIDNVRAAVDRLKREVRDACFLYKPETPLIYNEPINDNVSYNMIVFSHRDPQNPDQNEYVRYRLDEINEENISKIFPNGKKLVREKWSDEYNDWVEAVPVTEAIIKDIVFKKQGQLIKFCLTLYVKFNKNLEEYIFLGNIGLRNNLIVGGCAP